MATTLSNTAEADLANIWLHIANDRPGAADQLIGKFTETFNFLAQHPQVGEVCPGFGKRVRVYSVRNYSAYFRATESGVDIMRVVHGARQIKDLYTSD